MIHIQLQPEPPDFDDLVRIPGNAFLAHTPRPTQSQWNRNSFWRKIALPFYDAYSRTCAYTCHWIPPDTGWRTVEHFRPKSKYPHDAYDWANYRLVCGILNNRKGTKDILDPFTITNGWFQIVFPSLMIVPNPELSEDEAKRVKITLEALKLNVDKACIDARFHWLIPYVQGSTTFSYLEEHAPFIAQELIRQDLVIAIKSMMAPVPVPVIR